LGKFHPLLPQGNARCGRSLWKNMARRALPLGALQPASESHAGLKWGS
jgi:hypothetical protein